MTENLCNPFPGVAIPKRRDNTGFGLTFKNVGQFATEFVLTLPDQHVSS
jgi:hypothetical protein